MSARIVFMMAVLAMLILTAMAGSNRELEKNDCAKKCEQKAHSVKETNADNITFGEGLKTDLGNNAVIKLGENSNFTLGEKSKLKMTKKGEIDLDSMEKDLANILYQFWKLSGVMQWTRAKRSFEKIDHVVDYEMEIDHEIDHVEKIVDYVEKIVDHVEKIVDFDYETGADPTNIEGFDEVYSFKGNQFVLATKDRSALVVASLGVAPLKRDAFRLVNQQVNLETEFEKAVTNPFYQTAEVVKIFWNFKKWAMIMKFGDNWASTLNGVGETATQKTFLSSAHGPATLISKGDTIFAFAIPTLRVWTFVPECKSKPAGNADHEPCYLAGATKENVDQAYKGLTLQK